jgi:predicted transcriptional regulator
MTRRADGQLEADVLRALWAIGGPASPNDVIETMGTGLAYTSIATVLGRLCDKGLVRRERHGRAFHYEASRSEADLTAHRLCSILDAASDRQSALVGFVNALDPSDAARLADILKDLR